jgi:formylglycine-generating enzyme required for sulfatase activity
MIHNARSRFALLLGLAGLLLLFGCEEDRPDSLGITINIDANPKEINAPWTLTGPGGFTSDGEGDRTFRNLNAGEYTLTWGEVDGYIQPSRNPHNQNISEGRTFTFSGTYTPDFVDVVKIEPKPDGIAANWQLAGPGGYSLDGTGATILLDMAAGAYTITWEKVIGRSTPPQQTQTLALGGYINFVGNYDPLPEVDAIIINTEPDIIDAPWTVVGPGGFSQSGEGDAIISGRSPGEYTITWGDVVGYVTPTPSMVTATLIAGDIIEYNALYRLEDTLLLIPSGGQSFTMGSPVSEPGRKSDEAQHTVIFTRDYYIAPSEVTQAFWLEVVTSQEVIDTYGEGYLPPSPSYFSDRDCSDCPVESITWDQALRFCNAASLLFDLDPVYEYDPEETSWSWDDTKNGYRLPTEAEWEYACRAGTASSYYNGDIGPHGNLVSDTILTCYGDAVLDQAGWFCANADSTTHPAQTKDPNTYGLYDMHGNVYEWCWDLYGSYTPGSVTDPTGPYSNFHPGHVIRGGSWQHRAKYSRSAARGIGPADKLSPWPSIGLRLARNAD